MKVSVVIPNRRERFLQQTIDSTLATAHEDVEVVVSHDACWPDPPLREDPRVIQVHHPHPVGMRDGINSAIRASRGSYILKLDGHCLLADGWDVALKAQCDGDWIVVPRRYSLDAEHWGILETGKRPVDAHFLSWPFARPPSDPTCGLHGQVWTERARSREHVLLDDEMSSQGSCYFLHRSHWERLGELDAALVGSTFHQEFQEVGNKCWLSGGRVVVNKSTWYAHLHKGKQYGTGYGFSTAQWAQWAADAAVARRHAVDYWLGDRWPQRVRDFRWLLERFWPVPGWPADWEREYREQRVARGWDVNDRPALAPAEGEQDMKPEKAAQTGGVVINAARYGTSDGGERWGNVTKHVRGQVKDGRLKMPVRSSMLGGDPAPHRAKRLEVEYTVDGGPVQTATVPEKGTLRLPPPA